MKARIPCVMSLIAGCIAVQSLLAQTPNPPETGPFSVQMFIGGTTSVYLAVNPPTTFADGTPIPEGTPVQINIYRSLDNAVTYTTPVQLLAGGQGRVGQGAFGSQEKPWIDITASTPVDGQPPYVVYLAASCVVNGVESAANVANLTFIYYPDLTRLALPSDAPGNQWPGNSGGNGNGGPLTGTWTLNGQATMTISQEGNVVSGSISGGGQRLGTISGTFENGQYNLRVRLQAEGQTMDVGVVARVSDDRKLVTGTVSMDGESWPMSLNIDGSNLNG